MAIAQMILDNGADFELKNDEGYVVIQCATEEPHINMVMLLLNKGANIKDVKLGVVLGRGGTAFEYSYIILIAS
jgi:hypothetical protein